MKKRLLIIIIIGLVAIQFFRIDTINPEAVFDNDFITITKPNKKITHILETACYDCHSNKTVYPWYANVAPISWWIKHHVDEAKEHLNFSEWGTYSEEQKEHKVHECYEEVEEGEMPLNSYTWMHDEAKLSVEDREKLAEWFDKFGALEGHESDGD